MLQYNKSGEEHMYLLRLFHTLMALVRFVMSVNVCVVFGREIEASIFITGTRCFRWTQQQQGTQKIAF